MIGIARETAVVSLPPADTVSYSPTLRRRQDLSWFRNRPKTPTQCDTTATRNKYLAQNLPPMPTPKGGQPVEPPKKLARRATDGVSRIISSMKRKNGQDSCLDQLAAPLSSADAHLRRRAYSYNEQHVDTIYQTLRMAVPETPWPRSSSEGRSLDSSVSKAAARLLTIFPDMATELPGLRDFACTLDHAGVRWYGRLFVGRSCLCFTGTGITLSGTANSGQRSPPPAYRRNSEEPACVSRRSLSSTFSCAVNSPSQWPGSPTPLVAASRPESSASRSCKPWRKTTLKIAFHDITRVSKELTMGLWPNAMTLATGHRQYIFTNFLRRDRAYQCLSEAWKLHCQQRRTVEKCPLVERLPVVARVAARKNLPKMWPLPALGSNHELPLLLPPALSACESESTMCEHPSAIAPLTTHPCDINACPHTDSRESVMPMAKHDDAASLIVLMVQTLGSSHAFIQL
ncbi:GRAM domain-containing protein, partial [Coemansia sp. S610]